MPKYWLSGLRGKFGRPSAEEANSAPSNITSTVPVTVPLFVSVTTKTAAAIKQGESL